MKKIRRKGTKVYTRLQPETGREITVRKLHGAFTLYVDNQEMQQFDSQAKAMEAADRLAGSPERSRGS